MLNILNRYKRARTKQWVTSVVDRMDAYDLPGSTEVIGSFVDALNNWYIRRSRDRFWAPNSAENAADKRDAHDTLYTVLVTFAQVAAPFLPMVADEIHSGLTGGPSVHLADWPDPAEERMSTRLNSRRVRQSYTVFCSVQTMISVG